MSNGKEVDKVCDCGGAKDVGSLKGTRTITGAKARKERTGVRLSYLEAESA